VNPSEDAFQIRRAVLADLDTVVEYNRLLALETESKRLDPVVLRRGVRVALERPEHARYWLAEHQGRPVGQTMVTFEWSDWRCGLFWWIQSVYVEASHRRAGVFRRLFETIRADAQAEQACGLRLYVENHNERARATYARMGLAPSGHTLMELDWSGAITIVE
jgi:GNAT superfamily N-acetyltransferase